MCSVRTAPRICDGGGKQASGSFDDACYDDRVVHHFFFSKVLFLKLGA